MSNVTLFATIFGALTSGGGVLGLLQWWSSRRTTKVTADSTVMDSASKVVDLVTTQMNSQAERIRGLEAKVDELDAAYRYMLEGCLQLTAQVIEEGHKPVWTPTGERPTVQTIKDDGEG